MALVASIQQLLRDFLRFDVVLVPFIFPPRLRKLQKRKGSFENATEVPTTIESYGWYSGLCLGATVG